MTTLSSKPNIFFTSILESKLHYLTFFQSNLRTNAFNVIMTDDHIDEGNEDMTLRILFFFPTYVHYNHGIRFFFLFMDNHSEGGS